jgi:hypothetical protein
LRSCHGNDHAQVWPGVVAHRRPLYVKESLDVVLCLQRAHGYSVQQDFAPLGVSLVSSDVKA